MGGDIKTLFRLIEQMTGRKLKKPRDFDRLTEDIRWRTREPISTTTLKRLTGYLKEPVTPREITHDTLARFVGYADYDAFCHDRNKVQSHMVMSERLSADELGVEQRLFLRWMPDRVCVICHKGNAHFEIERAENSKLKAGDTFDCHLFVAHEPLYLDHVVHGGQHVDAYVVGKGNGVTFETMDAAE